MNSDKSDYIIKPCPEEIMRPSPESCWRWVGLGFVKPIVDRMKIEQEVVGLENLREVVEAGKPVFSFSNHVSWADHFLIMNMMIIYLQARVSALTKENYFKYPFFGWVMRRVNQVPITNIKLCFARWFKQAEGRPARRSDFIEFMTESIDDPQHEVNMQKRQSLVRTVVFTREMLARNRIILCYPEGTRSKHSSMQPIKTGIIQLPFECKGCIVPTAIMGSDKILPMGIKWYTIFKFFSTTGSGTTVKFGPAIDYTELLETCRGKFERIGDMVNLESVRVLAGQIEDGSFRAYTVEAEKFERIFDESSLIIMRAVNDLLPEQYKTEHVEIKYPR
jgi:1-acyl-sn-glycerol-3-phosphate acyltransferase